MDDDFEIEVTDLRTGQVLKTTHDMPIPEVHSEMPRTLWPGPAAAPEEHDVELKKEISDRSGSRAPTRGEVPMGVAVPARQRPTRRQVIGASASAALVAAVLIGLLGRVVSKGGFTFGLFPTPVPPTATLTDVVGTLYMVNAVPWGQLRADGKLVSVTYSQQNPIFFSLPTGRHSIQYDAGPFPTVHCTVSVPAARTDTCPLYTPSSADTIQSIPPGERGIDFGDTLPRLSPSEYQALVNTVSVSLAAPIGTTTVPAGGRYQGANGQVTVSLQSLEAKAYYALTTEAPSGASGESCMALCDIPYGIGAPSTSGWGIVANVTPVWRYTDSSGTAVQLPATPQVPGAPVNLSSSISLPMYVAVDWIGAWKVAGLFNEVGDPGCFDAFDLIMASTSFNSWRSGRSFDQREIVAPNPADGCLMLFQLSDGQGNLTGKPLWYLYRFGLIFAANAAAHGVSPELPVATGHEATLARVLAQLLAQQYKG